MKKLMITFFAILPLMCFSQKFWEQSNLSSSYDKNKTYRVAILNVETNDMELQQEVGLKNTARRQMMTELTGVSNFVMIPLAQIDEACKIHVFGGTSVSASDFPKIAKSLNADLFVTCELSKDKAMIKRKEIGTVMAYIEVYDVQNSTIIYTGKARSINPISLQVETEMAVQRALRKLLKL